MSIKRLIDQAARCVICGASAASGCDCSVELRCPACGKSIRTEHIPESPPGTAVVLFPCPECTPEGTTPDIHFLGKDGQPVFFCREDFS